MFSLKNKKQKRAVFVLAVLFFSSSIYIFTPSVAHAIWPFDAIANTVYDAILALLYGVFVMIGWFASMAITLFEWAIYPDFISGNAGLLNRGSIYAMWKLIRDFFNLFFILTLLYTAFTIVFQVAKNYKQTLLSIILAAMFVNFSFPITRVIIDMTNVPMYYFVNQIGSTGQSQKDFLGTVLSATKIQSILIPGSENGIGGVNLSKTTVSQLLMAIVFLFTFSITLLVLAIMFVIRLAALIILLIFSSVGFAASVIPGMQKYGNMWWEKLAQYALFGPSAMLMLFIATRFFAEISEDNTKAQFVQAGLANATPETAGFISSMAMFTIPIVMLWMAIGLAMSSSLVGAGAVVGLGYAAIKGTGKALAFRNPISNTARGLGSGVKDAAYKGKILGWDYGSTRFGKYATGKWIASPSNLEARAKGFVTGRTKGARTEVQKLKDKQINEQISKDKENKLSRTDAINRLSSGDEVMRISAATSLANMDHGITTMDDLTKALDALKDPNTGTMNPAYSEKAVEIVAKADKKIISDSKHPTTGATISGLENLKSIVSSLGNNEKAISDLISKIDDSAFSLSSGADYDALVGPLNSISKSLVPALKNKMAKEGRADILVESISGGNPALVQTAVDAVLGEIKSTKDMVGNAKLFEKYETAAKAYVGAQSPERQTEIKRSAAQDSPEVARRII